MNFEMDLEGRYTRRDVLRMGATGAAGLGVMGLLGGCAGGGIAPIDGPNYVLNLQYAEHELAGYRIRTRTYNGQIPGPTMRVRPGQTLRIAVRNQLPPNPPMINGAVGNGGGMHRQPPHMEPPLGNFNNPHAFNTTNLHVHGPQVIPHLFEPDGYMVRIDPGTMRDYVFKIVPDQPPGLYWYHPHCHGSTDVQVSSGMAGLIVIEGDIDRVPEIADARDELFAIQSIRVDPSTTNPNLYEIEPIAGATSDKGGYKLGGYAKTIYTVNGQAVCVQNLDGSQEFQALPTYQMRPGEVMRLRMLNGTNELFMPIALDDHVLHVIGFDGINTLRPWTMPAVNLAPANRAEILIKANMQPGTYILRQLEQNEQFGGPVPMMPLAQIVVSGPPLDMPLPRELPVPTREYPLFGPQDVQVHRSVAFSVVFPYSDPTLLTGVGFELNNEVYDELRIDQVVNLGMVEEWLLTNSSPEGHPFHIHVNSFQVVEIGGEAVEPYFADNIWIPKNSSVKFRIKTRTWTGKAVYHCHLLPHEDTGMMQNFVIQ